MMKCTTMLVVLLGIAFLVEGLSVNNMKDDKRMDVKKDNVRAEKRSLNQFKEMIECATGRSAWDYNNYGRWCGMGGKGKPVDGVDRCCQAHDKCYTRHGKIKPKSISYKFHAAGKAPSCEIFCSANDRNKEIVCKCDKAAAECFAENTYHPKFKKSIASTP